MLGSARAYSGPVIALSLGQAKTIAVVVAAVLVVGSVAAAWVMKSITQKVVAGLVLAGLALVVWTQRAALDDCADEVRGQVTTSVTSIDTTCRFFGRDVTISTAPGD